MVDMNGSYPSKADPPRRASLAQYVVEKLQADGFSGLCGDGCGCSLEDLMDCGEPSPSWCHPGYVHYCRECPHVDIEGACPIEECPKSPLVVYCVGPTKGFPAERTKP